jgi:uncharacterized membrane protein (UPF0127 family)
MKRVKIVSKKRVLWPKCLLLETPGERASGLMFKGSASIPLAIPFPTTGRRRNALHSLFCPVFDAIFLDASGRVVDVQARVKPNRLLIVPAMPCKLVLEVAPGESARVKVGDLLSLERAKRA